MDATKTKLPDGVQTLKSMLVERDIAMAQHVAALAQHHAMLAEQATTIAELQRDKEGLEHRLSLALRRLYGRTSEKIDAAQLLLFGQSMQEQAQRVEALADAQEQA